MSSIETQIDFYLTNFQCNFSPSLREYNELLNVKLEDVYTVSLEFYTIPMNKYAFPFKFLNETLSTLLF